MADPLLNIPIDEIRIGKLPLRQRTDQDDLRPLMNSIQRYGVIEPLVVMKTDSGYELVVGRRRFEACRRLGLRTVPSIVRRISKERAQELSYQSNLQVRPLNIADETDFLHLPDSEVAQRLAMTESEVALARRFNRLPPAVREAVRTGVIDERRGLALTRLSSVVDQTRVFEYILAHDPPIEALEKLVDRVRDGDAPHI